MSIKLIVIGGGASGMMCAGTAANAGANVILLEKKDKLGLKLSLTGKGRGNITNSQPNIKLFIEQFGRNGKFLYSAFNQFFNKELIKFFEDLGVQTKEGHGGRIFPQSENAWDIVDALRKYLYQNNVHIELQRKVKELLHFNNEIRGVITDKGNLFADKIVIATGGASYPKTGSTGDGYKFAKDTGHRVNPIYPVLVPLELKQDTSSMNKLKLKNIAVSVWKKDKKLAERFGECIFTDFGLDGAVILSLSRELKQEIRSDYLTLKIDLKPGLSDNQLHQRIIKESNIKGKSCIGSFLKSYLPQQIIPLVINRSNIDSKKQVSHLIKEERKRLINTFKNLEFTIIGTRPISSALVTSGGVELSQIEPKTMASKIMKGLYFVGEILDLDAETGGYNLQAAFSTGYLAGKSAAKKRT